MKINGQPIKAKSFAYDECHKIYLIEDKKDEAEAKELGYSIFPIRQLSAAYENSCNLRFINNWKLTNKIVQQFEDAEFSE